MYDYLFAGGGLASCLTARRLRQRDPAARILVLEAGDTLGGNHTWSFFETDLTGEQLAFMAPLVRHRWDRYEVSFPGGTRIVPTPYCCTDSARLHDLMMTEHPDLVRLHTGVASIDVAGVVTGEGERLDAACVIDGRGPMPLPSLALGFQKFTGLRCRLEAPHGLRHPVIMDATVDQDGDYRFFYLLPFDDDDVLIEDTRYSDTPEQDASASESAISEYIAKRGWRVRQWLGREQGALPIVLGGDIEALWQDAGGIPRIGLRAALFHATTGYSLPDAVRTADDFAHALPQSTGAAFEWLAHRSIRHWRAQGYWRLLNRMLFIAAEPASRWRVMERFYSLPAPLIERFYAGRSTFTDKARILIGKPPVPIGSAIACVPSSSAMNARRSH